MRHCINSLTKTYPALHMRLKLEGGGYEEKGHARAGDLKKQLGSNCLMAAESGW